MAAESAQQVVAGPAGVRPARLASGQPCPGERFVDGCGCRKPASPGQMLCSRGRLSPALGRRAGRSSSVWRCDDLRLVGLKLIFLVVTRAVSVLRLSRREAWWKDAEILLLRHQLAVALRERPRVPSRLTWLDRAWLALLAGTLPAGQLAVMRLIVTPATILRWHRGIVRGRRARLSRRGRSGLPLGAPYCAVGGAPAGAGE